MKDEKDEKAEKAIKIQLNPTLPTIFVDNLIVSPRKDGHLLVRLAASLPEDTWQEQVRFMVAKEDLKRMLNVLCTQCDHYPVKTGAAAPKAKDR